MNSLKILLQARGIENPNQLRLETRNKDPEKKGISPTTAGTAWHDPLWVPSAPTLRLLCLTFGIQPGDFLFYIPGEGESTAEPIDFSRNITGKMSLSDAIIIARKLGVSLDTLAQSVKLDSST
jgi:Cro/C1-type HTH DNA-binding domain